MQIKIPIGPLSVNKASKGHHYKSADYLKFEKDVCILIPFSKGHQLEGELFIKYVFYVKNYSHIDEDNCVKLIQDILVKRGYIKDDRYIKAKYSMKEPVKTIQEEKIVTDIVLYKDRLSVMNVH